jgi:hypothetical protein
MIIGLPKLRRKLRKKTGERYLKKEEKQGED